MSTVMYSQPLGQFEDHSDIGMVEREGFIRYDSGQQSYHIGGAGQNMWADHDDFHFIWKRMDGDFLLTARFEFIGGGVNPHRKVGWMARQSLDPDAMYADAVIHGDGLTSLQFRPQKGDNTTEIQSQISSPDFIQFERQNNTFIMRAAKFGFPLQEIGRVHLPMDEELYIGVAICSHEKGVLEEATLTNVRFTTPAPEDFQPYQDYSGSRLETINVENGKRRILYTSPDPLEAPNWTPDGKALIYNSKGLLYRFDLQEKKPKQIDTGFATQCNNDHVISFDGTMLAISHHTETKTQSGSMIYTLPIRGGTPQKVTDRAPSYLHGWSPDGETLVYTAKRNGVFN